MKHSYTNEVWGIYGKQGNFSTDYLKANGIEEEGRDERKPEGKAYRKMWRVGCDSFKLTTANGVRVVYMMGEKTFFDTREERDNARKERAEALAENARRKKAMEKINALTIEELEKLVATL